MGKAEDECPKQAVVGFASALCRSLCQMLGPHPLSPQQFCSLCSLDTVCFALKMSVLRSRSTIVKGLLQLA